MKLNNPLITVFNRTATSFDKAAKLPSLIGERLLERLGQIHPQASILDLGTGTGNLLTKLRDLYPEARIVGVDIALKRLYVAKGKRLPLREKCLIAATANQLPFPDQSFDLIFSNLVFHWCEHLDALFYELQRILRPNGLLLFSILGPDTLKELRHCWSKVDQYTHINQLIDMHDIGDCLLQQKFLDPVMDREALTINYPDIYSLFNDLKALGSLNLTKNKCSGLMGHNVLKRLIQAYECLRASNGKLGKLPASFEIIYGHAQGSQPNDGDKVAASKHEVMIPVSHIRSKIK